MFVDFSDGKAVKMDPDLYPEGIVVRIIRLDGIVHGQGVISLAVPGPLRTFKVEKWTNQRESSRYFENTFIQEDVSLTEQEFSVEEQFEQYGEARFDVHSLYRDYEGNTLWKPRRMSLGLIRYEEGWTLEISGNHDLQVPLPKFNPKAKVSELPEDLPPGRPLWERLGDDG